MVGIRHKARIGAMQVLSIITTRKFSGEEQIEKAFGTVLEEHFTQHNERDFLKDLVQGVLKNRLAIDAKVKEYAPRFPLEKMAVVDRSILEMAMYEMLFSDIPNAIIINEAIEIAKEFGDEGSAKLINGVLGQYIKERNQ